MTKQGYNEEGPFSCGGCTCEEEGDSAFLNHVRYPSHNAAFDEQQQQQQQAPLYVAPKVRGFPTYSSAPDQPLFGVPIREGGLWHLSTQDRFEPVTYALYVNGFFLLDG